ncbi:MAG: T9SS type A sorting domain-containing protein, partial [Ignavibacteriaceae bacterium]|nr:T9SS type A sorting domain-containing protein [Ignavibacteriaceae bacterium]
MILKIDDSGDLLWRKSYGGLSMDYFNDIVLLDNNEFFVVGNTGSFGSGKTDAWVLKFSADTITTFVEDEFKIVLPDSYILYQNYRNPFNPSTVISYQLPVSSDVTLKVYDVLGNEVATLVDEYKPAGSYEVKWSASNHSSGVYFYQLHTGNFVETKKL